MECVRQILEGVEDDDPRLAFLRETERIYQILLAKTRDARRKGDIERFLRWAQITARFAAVAHTGRYSDGALENLILDIGLGTLPVPRNIEALPASTRGRRVLHVATRLLNTGGHTRLLARWIANETDATHHVVVTDQKATEVPLFVRQTVVRTGGGVVALGTEPSRRSRASALRELARTTADLCILHTHQFDPAPVIAFAVDDLPPVAIMNHADYQFWLGASVGDAIINFRDFAQRLTPRRHARNPHVIPIPLRPVDTSISREEARRKLGVGTGEVMLMTMGIESKYEATPLHDFYAAAREILDRHSSARLFMVGVSERAARARLGSDGLTRLHAVGLKNDPTIYQRAADIYLEGMPYGSFTALFETAAAGVCPVVMYAPNEQVDSSEDPGLRRAARSLPDRATYIDYVSELIHDSALRQEIAAMAREDLESSHMGEGWARSVRDLYFDLESAGHHAAPLPQTEPEAHNPDLLRAEWDEHRYGRYPLMSIAAAEAGSIARLAQLLKLSARAGDTRLTAQHTLAWGGMLVRLLRGYRV
jgi:hypothetical protein